MNRCGTSLQGQSSTAQFAVVSTLRLRPALFDSVEIAVAVFRVQLKVLIVHNCRVASDYKYEIVHRFESFDGH
jgi:hypothetical protein